MVLLLAVGTVFGVLLTPPKKTDSKTVGAILRGHPGQSPFEFPWLRLRQPPVEEIAFQCLMDMRPEDMAQCDIATLNLLCAKGLPGSEDMDIRQDLATLDEWARRVERETKRNHSHPIILENRGFAPFSRGKADAI